MMIEFSKSKKRLATLWFIMSCIVMLLMITASLTKLKNESLEEYWGWLFPNIIPTLTLILSVFFADMHNSNSNEAKKVDRFYFRISFYFSFFYLLLLLLIISFSIVYGDGKEMLSQLRNSNIYLGPLQGILSASVGLFFFKK